MDESIQSKETSTSGQLSGQLYDELDVNDPFEKIDALLADEQKFIDFDGDEERSVAVAYPDMYPNGIANLSHQNLYKLVNRRSGWYATRTYEPDEHLKDELERSDKPYFTWEDKKPLADHDIVMFSLSFEELAPKMLSILEAADIPVWAHNRTEDDPLVLCGGATPNYNPEPYAHFVDCFYIGESEVGVPDLLEAYEEGDSPDTTRREYLKRFAEETGVYVPRFYRVDYDENGELTRWDTIESEASETIARTTSDSIVEDPAHSLFVTPHIVYGEPSFSLEVGRGCAYSCNFCQYGHNNRSPRWLDLSDIRRIVEENALEKTSIIKLFYEATQAGYLDELFELVEDLKDEHDIDIRLGAFTANQVSEHMIEVAAKCGQENIIVAPEAASGEMRYAVGKHGFYDDEDIFRQAELCAKHNIPDFGLYLLNGIPGETKEHMREMGDLIMETCEHTNEEGVLEAHINPVFPKPLTPFQWAPMDRPDWGVEKLNHLIEYIQDHGYNVTVDSVSKSVIGAERYTASRANDEDDEVDIIIKSIVGSKMHYSQPILARGDRRVCDVLYDAYKNGNDQEAWEAALERHGIDDELFFRKRDEDESLPWGFIENNVRESQRESMWENVQQEVSSADD